MSDIEQNWSEVADRLEALRLKLRLHREQTGGTDVPEAWSQPLRRDRQGVQEAFEAAGNAVKDEASATTCASSGT